MRLVLNKRAVPGLLAILLVGCWGDYSVGQNDPFGIIEPGATKTAKTSMRSSDAVKSTTDHIMKALDAPVDIEYDQTPFIDIMDEFRDRYRINVILDQSALDDSLTEDDQVTINVKGVRMRSALRLMLARMNSTYVIQDEVLLIISMDVADSPEFFSRKIINCSELLRKIEQAESKRIGTIDQVFALRQGQPNRGSDFGGGGVFEIVDSKSAGLLGGDSDDETNEDEQAKEDVTRYLVSKTTAESLLIDAIENSISPDYWATTNGDGGLSIIGGCLVIHQTEEVIENVEKFLVDLSKAMDQEN